jgi:hypothetical protein
MNGLLIGKVETARSFSPKTSTKEWDYKHRFRWEDKNWNCSKICRTGRTAVGYAGRVQGLNRAV